MDEEEEKSIRRRLIALIQDAGGTEIISQQNTTAFAIDSSDSICYCSHINTPQPQALRRLKLIGG